jgi:peptidoglycan/LPS O-acetylase OafA/YrhL
LKGRFKTRRPISSSHTTQRDDRIPVLDGIRGLAIILVLINNIYPESAIGSVLDTQFVHFTDFWWIGVDLFFVLSGFLITGILADTRDGERYFRTFYARRILRIFPLYYLALFMLFVVIPHFGLASADQLHRLHVQRWYLFTYLGNLGTAFHGDTHFRTNTFWSLAVEEQFYLAWPLFVLWFDWRKLIKISLWLMAGSFVLRVLWLARGLSYDWVYMLTPFRFDGLLVGAMLALVMRAPNGKEWLKRKATGVWRVCAPLSLALIAGYELLHTRVPAFLLQVFGYPLIAFAFAALIVIVLNAEPGSRLERIYGSSVMRFFGRYSYGMYVWHGMIVALLMSRLSWFAVPPLTGGTRIPYGLLALALASALTIAAAFVSYNVWEKPILSLKRYFRYTRPVDQDAGLQSSSLGHVDAAEPVTR